MNISQLRFFTTVAQTENISRAAELLHISQPSLSKKLAQLEDELEMALFDRRGKNIVLNSVGKKFLEFCNHFLQELDVTLDDMRCESSGNGSRIRIGTAGLFPSIIDCMTTFRALHPETEFQLDGGIEYMDNLDINAFDVLIYPSGGRYDKFSGYPLYEERYFLAVSVGHPLSSAPSIAIRKLDGNNFIFLRTGKTVMEYPYHVCTALNVHFGAQNFTDSKELHRKIISSGLAVGFVSEQESSVYRNDPAIRLIPLVDQRFSRQMMICFRREKHLSPVGSAFRDYIIQAFSLPEETK